jgi:hypothetical protein
VQAIIAKQLQKNAPVTAAAKSEVITNQSFYKETVATLFIAALSLAVIQNSDIGKKLNIGIVIIVLFLR